MGSQVRQNYEAERCEAGINKQINMFLYADYVFTSMAFHFDRDDIVLPGHSKFFKKAADEEREYAQKLMKFQNMRGGRILLQDIKAPATEWTTNIAALADALALEKKVNESLLKLSQTAGDCKDEHMGHFLDEFLEEHVQRIKEMGEHLTQGKRCGDGLGIYIFDKDLA